MSSLLINHTSEQHRGQVIMGYRLGPVIGRGSESNLAETLY